MPLPAENLALEIVRKLQAAGHTAYFAGGCVRDRLMGREPKDFDVATSAHPEQVLALFPRSQQVGVAFGVVLVREKRAGVFLQVEVATFRSDGTYTDGRHPDAVRFTTPQEDAQRRDFTCNGLFFDPVANGGGGGLHDFVGGQADIQNKILRAIGNPEARFNEDHLRMLRAVRFAAKLGFEMEAGTRAAIQRHAEQIRTISRERVGEEMRMILADAARGTAVSLMEQLGLMERIWPVQASLEVVRQAMMLNTGATYERTEQTGQVGSSSVHGESIRGRQAAAEGSGIGTVLQGIGSAILDADSFIAAVRFVRTPHIKPEFQDLIDLAERFSGSVLEFFRTSISPGGKDRMHGMCFRSMPGRVWINVNPNRPMRFLKMATVHECVHDLFARHDPRMLKMTDYIRNEDTREFTRDYPDYAAKSLDVKKEEMIATGVGLLSVGEVPAFLTGQQNDIIKSLYENVLNETQQFSNSPTRRARRIDCLPDDLLRPLALAALCRDYENGRGVVEQLREALALSNLERDELAWLLDNLHSLLERAQWRRAITKKLLADPRWEALRALYLAERAGEDDAELAAWINQMRQEGVSPEPFVTGRDLIVLGGEPGKEFKEWLDSLYDRQLEGEFAAKDQALAAARKLIEP